MTLDWQSLLACSMGLAALVHVSRRWWPSVRGLFLAQQTRHDNKTLCDKPPLRHAAPSPCGGGCSQCANGASDGRTPPVRKLTVYRR